MKYRKQLLTLLLVISCFAQTTKVGAVTAPPATTAASTTTSDAPTTTATASTTDATTVAVTTTLAETTTSDIETTPYTTTEEQTTTVIQTTTAPITTSAASTTDQTTTNAQPTSTAAPTTTDATTAEQTTTDVMSTSTVAETTSDATTIEQTTTGGVTSTTAADTTTDATTVGQTTTDGVTSTTAAETTTDATTVGQTTTDGVTSTTTAETTTDATTVGQTTTDGVTSTTAAETTSDATTVGQTTTDGVTSTTAADTTTDATTVGQTTTDDVTSTTAAETTTDATTVGQTTTDGVTSTTAVETTTDATTVGQTTTDTFTTSTVAETTSDATTVEQTTTDVMITSTVAETTSDSSTVEQTTMDDETTTTAAESTTFAQTTSTVAEPTSDATTVGQTTAGAMTSTSVVETTSDATTMGQTTTDVLTSTTAAETTSDATTVGQTTTDGVTSTTAAETTTDATTMGQTTTDGVTSTTVIETTTDATTVGQTTTDGVTSTTAAETTTDATTVGQTTTDGVTSTTAAETTTDATTVGQTTTDGVTSTTAAETTTDATTVGQTTTDGVTSTTAAETTTDATTVGQTTTDGVTSTTVAETTTDSTTVGQTTTDVMSSSTVAETTSEATTVGQTTTGVLTSTTVAETTSDARTVEQTTTDAMSTSTVAETTSDATTVGQTTTDFLTSTTAAETTPEATTVGQTTTGSQTTSAVESSTSDVTTSSQSTTDTQTTSTEAQVTSTITNIQTTSTFETTTVYQTTTGVPTTTGEGTTVEETTTDIATSSTIAQTTSEPTTVDQTTMDVSSTTTDIQSSSVPQTTTDVPTSTTSAETSQASTVTQTPTDGPTSTTIEQTSEGSTVTQSTTDAPTTTVVLTSAPSTVTQTTTDGQTGQTSEATTVTQTTTDGQTGQTSDATTVTQAPTDGPTGQTSDATTVTQTTTDGPTGQTSEATTVTQTPTDGPTGQTSDTTTVTLTTTDYPTSTTVEPQTSDATTVTQAPTDGPTGQTSDATTVTQAPTDGPTGQTSDATTVTQAPTDGPTGQTSDATTVTLTTTDYPTSTTVEPQTSDATTVTQAPTDGPTGQTSDATTVTQAPTDGPTGQTSDATAVTQSTTDSPTGQTSEATTVTQAPTDGPTGQTSEATTVTQSTTDGPTGQTSEATTLTQTAAPTTVTQAPTTVTQAPTTVTESTTAGTTTLPPVLISGLLFDFGPSVDTSTMAGTDDGCNDKVDIDYSVPFRNRKFRKIYVCANGLLCFNRRYESYTVPANNEYKNDLLNIYCLAPYFADINLSNTGRVWYTAIDFTADQTASNVDKDAIEARVQILVNEIYGVDNFSPAFYIRATWEAGPRYGGPENETVTFQVVFTSDGEKSYTFYSYSPGNMSFTSGSQFIGLLVDGKAEGLDDSSDGAYLRRPDETLTLEPYQGASTFRLVQDETDETTNYRVQCRKWHKKESKNKVTYQTTLNQMPQCPCSSIFLFFDRQFGPITFDSSTASFTVPVLPRADYASAGKTCAYSWFTGSFISTGANAGSFNTYNALSNPRENAINDVYYKNVCCQRSDLCNLYYDVRPTHSCYSSFPFSFANAFGDPHIATLDGFTYTFNGHGEYVLLKISTIGFEVQSRTDRAVTADNTSSEATIFTAFAIQSAGAWVQVELDANKTGLYVFVGNNNSYWADLTDSFYDDGNSFSYVTDSLSLSRDDKTLITSFSGISFNVTTGVGLLQMNTGLSNSYRSLTEGLLGNFNNDATDDMIPRGLTVPIASTSTGREIFEDFGSTWITTSDESIFKYNNGKSHADYSFPDFVPKFLDEANQTLVAEATVFCGEDNNQCIFDLVFTGNNELAADTTATETQAAENAADASNIVPALIIDSGITSIDGENYLYTTLNEPVNFTLLGTDDGLLTYQFVNNTAGATLGSPQNDGTIDISLLLSNTDPVYVSVTAEDDRGVSAPVIDVVVVLCTGCNDHGTCNHSLIRDDDNATDSFKYATCECTQYWTGTDCETDFDGCEVNPCSVGRTCSDNTAQVHSDTGVAYTCSPCPSGYQDIDDKCFDIDECSDASTNNCSQVCVNTDGSYDCRCNTGYRLASDGYDCDDINECEESTSNCGQICTNTDGGFTCSCFIGFQLNALTQTCDQGVLPLCNALDCSNADGCSLNDTGSAVCICNAGYQLQDDNSCTNIDECAAASVCSQACQDTVGSFTCSCYKGYKLETDGNTCTACEFPAYGDSCSSTCQCGRGSTGCDNVSGCICETGWTGTNCDTDVDECLDANICGDSNKVCTNTIGSYTCTCRSGFSLLNGTCTDINECDDPTLDDCQQVCSNTIGGYSCSCRTGYVIDSTNSKNCLDLDECAAGISGCEQICINFDGRSSCECYFGFLLNSDRKTCSKVADPCINFPDADCSDICLVVNDAAVCSCSSGYTLGADQKTCIDINECDASLDLNECSEPDSCVNSEGGYECSCVDGFKLENDKRTCTVCDEFHYGFNCSSECNCGVGATRCDSVTGCVCESGWLGEKCDVDKDECQIFPTVCTGIQEECTNTPGSYICNCESGYQKNSNDICTDIDECSSTTLNDCSQICTNTVGGYQCSCNSGFMQNGTLCNDINECEGQNECTQVCTNNVGYYRCSCDDGFKLDITDKVTCMPEISCDPSTNPCGANTDCAIISSVETCSCLAGYQFVSGSSLVCEDIAECSAVPSPCSQECQELQGSYMCACDQDGYKLDTDQSTCIVCPDGTYGDDCLQNCTCGLNTESCDSMDGTCNCADGWTGVFCTQDINECSNSAIHQCPINSVCINTPGSFDCRCNAGFLKSSDGTCQACDSAHWGTNCANNCTCVEGNTDTCDPVDGTCTCNTGWSDSTCSSDVDECAADPSICGDVLKTCQNTVGSYSCVCNSGYTINNLGVCIDDDECLLGTSTCVYQCTNTPGTFECSCFSGYTGTGNTCTPCAFGFWGVQCVNTCGCNSTNTIECDAASGCTCRSGFTGTTCEDDIDECSTGGHSCPADSTCTNIHGSHQCDCNIGYLEDTNGLCQVCSNNTYGNDCQSNCDCENDNSANPGQSCDHVTGTCQCTAYWNGTRCETDINECAAGTSGCDAANQGCHNTEGGFQCSCLLYYEVDSNGVCVEDPDWTIQIPSIPGLTTTRLSITLNYTISSGTDLTVFATFEYYAAEISTKLLSFFRTSMGVSLNDVVVSAVTAGSLKANMTLLYTDDTESAQNFASAIRRLQTGSEVQIFNQQTTTQELVLDDDTIIDITDGTNKKVLCAAFLASRGSNCDSSSECVLVDGAPTCQPRKTTDNFGLVIGLGVGIPLFLIAALIVGVVIIYTVKSKRKQRYYTEDMDRGSFNNGFFPHMMPTKINTWGRGDPVGIYGPNTWDDDSASTATDDGKQYRRGRDMLRSDEVYRAYDNDNGPVSNFSWDFLYNYIHPHERYEIQRPQHEQHPHPVFTS